MYRIIGADGRQYGPATADQIREWIAAGRADGQTLAQAEGTAEWKPLSTFPEFTAAFPPKAVPPLASVPPVVRVDPVALANDILRRGYAVDIGGSLSRAWKMLTGDFWPIIGTSALILLILGVTNFVGLGLLLTGPLIGGLDWYFLKRIRGQKVEVNDAFAGFTLAFVQLLLVSLVSGLLIGLGLLCCLVPGIYLAVAWCLAIPLAIDKRIAFWDAMEVSRKVVTRRWWSFLGLLLVYGLVNLGGILLCCVGFFITSPLTTLATMYVYEDIFGAPPATTSLAPPVPGPMPPLMPTGRQNQA
jgi:hypothetical protein